MSFNKQGSTVRSPDGKWTKRKDRTQVRKIKRGPMRKKPVA